MSVAASRRRLATETLGFTFSSLAFGLVYGLAARGAGLSFVEAMAMSLLVLAGAAQFAAVGLIAQGVAWPAIVLLTALLNARHLLYSASLAPWFRRLPRVERGALAHVMTDEVFAVSLAHFRRIGRTDVPGYALAGALVGVPWILATAVGVLGGTAIPDPRRFGLDVVFPAAMAGLTIAIAKGRREVLAAGLGAAISVAVAVVTQPSVGIVAGGLIGAAIAMATPGTTTATPPAEIVPDRAHP